VGERLDAQLRRHGARLDGVGMADLMYVARFTDGLFQAEL